MILNNLNWHPIHRHVEIHVIFLQDLQTVFDERRSAQMRHAPELLVLN